MSVATDTSTTPNPSEMTAGGVISSFTMEKLGDVNTTQFESDQSASIVRTVYLYDCRIKLDNNSIYTVPTARLEYYESYKKTNKTKKLIGKQYVFSHVTLWEPSTFAPNSSFIIMSIKDIPITLYATTDSAGRITARSIPPPTPVAPAAHAAPVASKSDRCLCCIQ
jgi:hypothetical protein